MFNVMCHILWLCLCELEKKINIVVMIFQCANIFPISHYKTCYLIHFFDLSHRSTTRYVANRLICPKSCLSSTVDHIPVYMHSTKTFVWCLTIINFSTVIQIQRFVVAHDIFRGLIQEHHMISQDSRVKMLCYLLTYYSIQLEINCF